MDFENELKTNEEFKTFVELQKQGLINKNNELLGKLKEANGKFENITNQFNELNSKIVNRENELKKLMFTKTLRENNRLKNAELLDEMQERAFDKIKNELTFDDDNNLVTQDKKSLQDYVNNFVSSDFGKSCIKSGSSGSGIKQSNAFDLSENILNTIDKMTAEQVAKSLDNKDFCNQLNKQLRG